MAVECSAGGPVEQTSFAPGSVREVTTENANMRTTVAASILLLGLSAPALAQSPVTATTDLNVRAGPGPHYPVVGVLGVGQAADLNGCIENSRWCSITTGSGDGWVYSDYLTADLGGDVVVLTERPADSGVAIVAPPEGEVMGGSVAGVLTGEVVETVIEPPPEVRDYVTVHEVEPVYLDGEIVVGAGLPETVELREVPDYEYRYVYVNGQPVLVDATSRRIVYIVR